VVWLAGSLLLGLAVTGSQRLVRSLGESRPWFKKVVIVIVAGLSVGMAIGGIVLAEITDVRVMPFFLLVMILVIMNATLRLTLSEAVQERIVQSIQIPANVGGWLDYWASADPVPNGSTRTRDANRPVSKRIWNEASFLRDHTAYRENRDGFALPIVRILADTARSAWRNRLPPETENADARSRWRTGWLRAARWAVPLASLLAGLQRGSDLEAIRLTVVGAGDVLGVATWFSWVPSSSWAFAFRWAVVAASSWVAYRILLAIWHAWVRVEQDQALRQRTPGDVPTGLRLFGLSVALVIAAALYLARTEWAAVQSTWQQLEVGDLALALLIIGVWSQVLVWFGAKIFPPPVSDLAPRREGGRVGGT
jgi:hypothetical protein